MTSSEFEALENVLQQDFRESVVKEVLEYQDQVSPETRKAFEEALQKTVKVAGFRNPNKAPLIHLHRSVIEASYKSGRVFVSILTNWLEVHKDLFDLAIQFLERGSAAQADSAEQEEASLTSWTSTKISQAIEEFQTQHVHLDKNELALALVCCINGGAPIEVSRAEQEEEGPILKWQQWLGELEALSADAPEWEERAVSNFFEAVVHLKELKRLGGLSSEIETLLQQAIEGLRFFEMLEDVSLWSAEACSISESVEVAAKVSEFREAILSYQELKQKPEISSISETLRVREEKSFLEEKIHQLHMHIHPLLTSLEPDPPLPDPTNNSSAEDEKEETDTIDSAEDTDSLLLTSDAEGGEETEITVETEAFAETPQDKNEEPSSGKESVLEEASRKVAEDLGVSESGNKTLPLSGFSQETASPLQEESSAGKSNSLLWQLIAEDDLPGAYWVSRSATASGQVPAIPDYLLAAVQGSRWLNPGKEKFVDDLRNLTIEEGQFPVDDAQAMFRLAAALRSALVAPRSGMLNWLQVPDSLPSIRGLVTAVEKFARNNIALQAEDLLGAAGAVQREAVLHQVTLSVQKWLEEVPNQKYRFRRASAVWQRLVGPQGKLRDMLLMVSQDRQQDIRKVQQQLVTWRQKNYISQQIRQTDHHLSGRRPQPIEGQSLQKMERDIDRACVLAGRWCELRSVVDQGDWRSEQVNQLCNSVKETQTEVNEALERQIESAGVVSLVAATLCLKRAVGDLCEFLNPSLEPHSAELSYTAWDWFTHDVETLSLALSRRLLWLPELSLKDEGLPRDEVAVAQFLRNAIEQERSLRTAFEGWLSKQDYRFVERLLDAMQEDEVVDSLSLQYQEALDGSREALEELKKKTEGLIEQTVVDGIMGEDRSEFASALESINSRTVQNFPFHYGCLEKVQDELEKARDDHLASLLEKWNELEERLSNSRIEKTKQERINTLVTEELKNKDTRIVEERLARLTEIMDDEREPEETWFSKPTFNTFVEYTENVPQIEEWYSQSFNLQGIARDIREQSAGSGKHLKIAEVQGLEYLDANNEWIELRHQPPQKLKNLHSFGIVLQYLGFEFGSGPENALELVNSGKDWLLFETSGMFTILPVKPIPQFGSQAAGHYSVLCFWERPGTDAISSRLREIHLPSTNVIFFYLGRLKERQRRDITRSCKDMDLNLAALDEDLLLFLATKEREARLSSFLQCALPLTLLNPYTPFQAGDVPPEMFYGREGMVRELLDPSGCCLVFGGRQLGKSALLRHVMRQFHDPEQDRFAWVEDMNLIFDPNAGRDSIYVWRALREMLKRGELISPKVTTARPDSIRRYLLGAMEENHQRRVLVMFDEADDFLDADSRDGFPVVLALRELMLSTQRRFKVIFTGLHDVQRFQGIPNQPLAHFGRPLCVGPLEPGAAQDLVREPLESLGYCFEDNAAILRILSYTNYHPGLIQLFCRELLAKLNEQRGNSLPPHGIKRDDVESIYRMPRVRDDIRKRFNWTLNLDPRYQAIAWSMIVHSDQTDIYSSVYSTGEILSLVRDWWPQGFEHKEALNSLQSLLEELCGLGVLYRDSMGYYRLRSPNLVRLMGTAGDIEERLLELSEKEPPSSFEANNHHAPLANPRQYSPLSYEQERILASPQKQSGVGLIFSSEALGMSKLRSAFRRFVPYDSSEGTYSDIPNDVTDGDQLSEWLDANLQTHGSSEQRVVCLAPSAKARLNLESLVDVALRFCTRHQPRTGQQWFRVLFLMDPSSTWHWLSLNSGKREELENRAIGVLLPLHWNLSGVRQRLTLNNMMEFEEVSRSILDQTGGWHMLLDTFFERCAIELEDPRPIANELGRELEESGSELTRRFRRSLGLDVAEAVNCVLELICENEHLEVECITPETIEQPALHLEDCSLAIEYLEQMGCIARSRNSVTADPIVKKIVLSQ